MFTDIEVVRLDLLLSILNCPSHEPVLNRFAILHSQPAHNSLDPVCAENAHQIVLKRQIKT